MAFRNHDCKTTREQFGIRIPQESLYQNELLHAFTYIVCSLYISFLITVMNIEIGCPRETKYLVTNGAFYLLVKKKL